MQEVPFEDIIALTVLTEPTETYWQVPSTLAQVNFFELFPSFCCLQHVTTVNFHFVRPDEVNSKLYVYMQTNTFRSISRPFLTLHLQEHPISQENLRNSLFQANFHVLGSSRHFQYNIQEISQLRSRWCLEQLLMRDFSIYWTPWKMRQHWKFGGDWFNGKVYHRIIFKSGLSLPLRNGNGGETYPPDVVQGDRVEGPLTRKGSTNKTNTPAVTYVPPVIKRLDDETKQVRQ